MGSAGSWALPPVQAPAPLPLPASGNGVTVPQALPRVFPGIRGVSGPLLGAGIPREGGLCEADWEIVAARLRLTMREAQIIRRIVTELKDQAIAHELGISYNTLRTQLSRLYRKLGVQTRIGVAVAVFSEALKIIGEKNEIELRRKKS